MTKRERVLEELNEALDEGLRLEYQKADIEYKIEQITKRVNELELQLDDLDSEF